MGHLEVGYTTDWRCHTGHIILALFFGKVEVGNNCKVDVVSNIDGSYRQLRHEDLASNTAYRDHLCAYPSLTPSRDLEKLCFSLTVERVDLKGHVLMESWESELLIPTPPGRACIVR